MIWRSKRRPQERRIEDFGSVGRRHHDHAVLRLETIHLGQQLVEGLLAFFVRAHGAGAARRPPMASSSSMKMMLGAAFLACSNRFERLLDEATRRHPTGRPSPADPLSSPIVPQIESLRVTRQTPAPTPSHANS